MTQPYVSKGKDVFLNPAIPGQTASIMHPAMVIPDDERPTINGEPVVDVSHEYVLKKNKEIPE